MKPEEYVPEQFGEWSQRRDPQVLFQREYEAYAHLLDYGVCEKGVVPYCYGWLTLTQHDLCKILAVPSISDSAKALASENCPLNGILLEYLPDAERLTEQNITSDIAVQAMKALRGIHTAYVRHGDVHRRNIMLVKGERVVWIDFDCSMCPSNRNFYLQEMFLELSEAWDYIYGRLVRLS
jgi:hypothetical protein